MLKKHNKKCRGKSMCSGIFNEKVEKVGMYFGDMVEIEGFFELVEML